MKLFEAAPPTDVPQSDLRGQGCMAVNSGTQIVSATNTPVVFDTNVYDDLGLHSESTNTERITVPAGVSRLRLIGLVEGPDLGATTQVGRYDMFKNGSLTWDGATGFIIYNRNGMVPRNLMHTVVDVVAGDYFHMQWARNAGPSVFTLGNNTHYFCCYVVQ